MCLISFCANFTTFNIYALSGVTKLKLQANGQLI